MRYFYYLFISFIYANTFQFQILLKDYFKYKNKNIIIMIENVLCKSKVIMRVKCLALMMTLDLHRKYIYIYIYIYIYKMVKA